MATEAPVPPIPLDAQSTTNTIKENALFNYKGWANYIGTIQLVLYGLSVFFGLITAIVTGVVLRSFDGRCILFAELVWDNKVIWPWHELSCDFVLYFTIAGPIAYAALMGLFTLVLILPRHSKHNQQKVGNVMDFNKNFILRGSNPVFVGINLLMVFFVLCAAGIVTGGTDIFCQDILKSMKEEGQDYGNCYQAQSGINWNKITVEGGNTAGVRGSNFYTLLTTASVTSWILFLVWLLLALLNIVRRCKGCSCATAEEKQKMDTVQKLALSRESRSIL